MTTTESLQSPTPEKPLPVVSLFSGAGGLDLAVENAGEDPFIQSGVGAPRPYKVTVATDYEPTALETLRQNFPSTATVAGDIREIRTAQLLDEGSLSAGDAALVVGGPPCTPFSKSGFWLEQKRSSSDPNASLLGEFARVVADARPEGLILENVQALTYKTHASHFKQLLQVFSELGYNPQWKTLLAADYGVPQLRKRVFIVGRRDGKPFTFPEPTHAGPSETSRRWDTSKPLHRTAGEAFRGMQTFPEDGEIVEGKYGELAAEVPPGQNYLWHTDRYGGRDEFKWRSRYWTFLLRLDPDRPSSTIQAQPGPYVGPFHWENVENESGELRARRLRTPELLRLMTFPDSFVIKGKKAEVQRQLGNAVPMELGKAVVRALALQLGHLPPMSESDHLLLEKTLTGDDSR